MLFSENVAERIFELPGKIGVERGGYRIIEGIYAGWAWFAVPSMAAILAIALFFAERRRDPVPT